MRVLKSHASYRSALIEQLDSQIIGLSLTRVH